ncbi:ATP-binding protein [Candidatus Woesearchaeota archaeon]|nr:ATP-binding protein [Candidatus Woesearchaeota archaeon]
MNKEQIIELLQSWNFWNTEINTGIIRESYSERIEKYVKTEQIIVITGIRRSGKSTIMKQFIKQNIQKGINKKNFLYVNFEEPQFAGLLSLDFLQQIYDAYKEIIQPIGKYFILLDEIQRIKGWEKFARAMHEKKEAMVIASGSNADLISKEFGTLLTGRWLEIKTYPLTFKEFLEFRQINIKHKSEILLQKVKIKQLLREYLQFGGFPLVVLQEEKEDILKRYYDDIITKDIAERNHVREIEKLRNLSKYYLTTISLFFSYRKLFPIIGVSLDTIERFSEYFSECYLLFYVRRFSYSLKEQEINQRKVYTIDPGIATMISFSFSENIGRIYENAVFIYLYQKQHEIYYYKTDSYEIDFVIKQAAKIKVLIQVCYNLNNPETRKREVTALIKASKELKCNNLMIITEDKEEEEIIEKKKIKYIPLWKWLLQ